MDTVFFTDMKTSYGNSYEDKVRKLVRKAGIEQLITPGELVAIKIHVGERGNLGYIHHVYTRLVVDEVKRLGGKPYLTDSNTLYSGGRHNAIDHMETAMLHGFSFATMGAPFIVADGLRGLDYDEVPVNGKFVKKAKIASGICRADKLIVLSHFKGHLEAGFGGSIKNLAMGGAASPGKLEQHSGAQPEVHAAQCVGCRNCFKACPAEAISMVNKKAVIDYEKCIGCGQCVATCNYEAMNPKWDTTHDDFLHKLCEYAYAVHNLFENKSLFLNFAVNITPDCDCWGYNDMPIVQDVGFLSSRNPLALDKATLDLVNKSRANPQSSHAPSIGKTGNVFRDIRSEIHNEDQFTYCEELGMDSSYQLETI